MMKYKRAGDSEGYDKAKKQHQKLSTQRDKLDEKIKSMKPKSKGSHTADPNAREKWAQTETTTYSRARKRRISQFDDWFFGSSRKR